MRQSGKGPVQRHEKVSNHRCQLPTKTKTSNYVLPKVGGQLKGVGEIAPPSGEEDKMEVPVTCTHD